MWCAQQYISGTIVWYVVCIPTGPLMPIKMSWQLGSFHSVPAPSVVNGFLHVAHVQRWLLLASLFDPGNNSNNQPMSNIMVLVMNPCPTLKTRRNQWPGCAAQVILGVVHHGSGHSGVKSIVIWGLPRIKRHASAEQPWLAAIHQTDHRLTTYEPWLTNFYHLSSHLGL